MSETWVLDDPSRPVAQPGPGGGEYVVDVPTGEGGRLVRPPGQSAAEDAMKATQAYLLGLHNTLTFGQGNRIVGASDVLAGKAPDYETGVNRQVQHSGEAAASNPYAYGAGELTGGVDLGLALGPLSRVPQMTTAATRLGAGAIESGLLGAAEGAGNTYTGKPLDYAENALKGGAIAGTMGGVLAPVAGAAGAGTYRGIASTAGVPARLAEAGATDAASLAEVAAGREGPRAMLPDPRRPAITGTAQGAVLDPNGPGARDLLTALRLRNESSPAYIDQNLNRIFGRAPVPSQEHAAVQTQIDALQPHYRRAFGQGQAVDTQPLADWLDTQIVNEVGQARTHLQRIRNDLDIQGSPGTLDPSPEKLGAARRDLNGLLRSAREAPGSVQPNTERLLREARRQMTDELQAKVPGIQGLDAMRAELGAQQRALATDSPGSRMFETGRTGVIRPEELAQTMTAAAVPKGVLPTTQEPLRLQQAARAELERVVGTKKNDLLALENLLANPQDWNSQKLAIMFGQNRADEIANILRNERYGREADTAVRLGSQTATRMAAQKAQDAQSGRLPLETTLTGLTARGVGWAKDQLFQAQAAAQRDRIARFLAVSNPADVQAAARQLIAIQPQRNVRADIVRNLLQGGTRGAAAGLVPKDYQTQ